eukprot:g24371.t1
MISSTKSRSILGRQEARQEPSWPNILPIYLKTKLKRDLSADVDAALRKVGATRAAGRAKVQQDEMEAQLQQAYLTDGRDESAAEQAALASAQDFRRRLRKNGTMLAKGEATWCRARQRWRAKVTTKNGRVIFGNYFTDKAQAFTEAQELAPAYGVQGPKRLARPRKAASASKAEKNEMMVLQSIKDAETEAQRRVKGRNTVVGAPATNKFGMIIETKQVCDQEKGTEWHNGRCIVSGEKQSPDTPEEVAAMTAVKAAQANYDESLEVVHSKNHTFKEADHKLKQTKADFTSTPKAQELRTKMENAKAVWDQAHVALNDAKAASKEKREKLSEALRKAIDVERNEDSGADG